MAVASGNGQPIRSEVASADASTLRSALRIGLGGFWIAFQILILFRPQAPLIERPLHLALATALLFLWMPLSEMRHRLARSVADTVLFVASLGMGAYYLLFRARLGGRMEGVDPVLPVDVVAGVIGIAVLLEGVRRAVGWPLLGVLAAFLAYGFLGDWMPGWMRFSGFEFDEAIEILTLSLNGILGITTGTSVQFVFYFILFGAVYSAIGGGRLVIDLGLRLTGAHSGGPAKAAVVSSSLMGSITGSAVANVAGTGVFTIPLMRRAGYSANAAGALEAIASTGGQLMPPIMGVAAFVMAEMLQVDYGRIAVAGLLPALAFYSALFISVDLRARKTGIGKLPSEALSTRDPIPPRLHLLAPPLVLVGLLVAGYSATYAAVLATFGCFLLGLARRETRLVGRNLARVIETTTRQACQVAVPIAAIGIIIAVAIQSNLALKFSTELIAGSGSPLAAMGLIVVGCVVMGMGLPTVAAYLIGAILFVPALKELGIEELSSHFFVMYYCVLSMVTPPVALASYAAAGISGGSAMRTSVRAFKLAFVCFLIPFAFAFEPGLLGQGDILAITMSGLALLIGTAGWAVAVVGHWTRPLRIAERICVGAAAAAVICLPTGSPSWIYGAAALTALAGWIVATRDRGRAGPSQAASHPLQAVAGADRRQDGSHPDTREGSR